MLPALPSENAEKTQPVLRGLDRIKPGLPARINADPQNVERGLAQLALTIIELLRQLMERQAIRRMEAGTLTDDEVERLGQTFMRSISAWAS